MAAVVVLVATVAVVIQGAVGQSSGDNSDARSSSRSALHTIFNALAGSVQVSVSAHSGSRPNHHGQPITIWTSSSCRYWCRTPENSFYCCDHTTTTPRPSRCCPPLRPECPRLGPPVPCFHDLSCANFADKCCYDMCLRQHVCKPSEPCFG